MSQTVQRLERQPESIDRRSAHTPGLFHISRSLGLMITSFLWFKPTMSSML